MTCEQCETNMLDKTNSGSTEEHISTCETCHLYSDLLNTHNLTISLSDDFITSQVNLAIEEALTIKKKYDLLSLLVFIAVASTLMYTIIFINIDFITVFKKYLWVMLSSIMPITLPIISVIRRKVAIR